MKTPKTSLMTAFLIASTLCASAPSANAGIGLSAGAISALADGNILSAAISGGLGAASIIHGVNRVNSGRIGWGVFFLVLKEKSALSEQEAKTLEGLDVAVQEAIMSVVNSELSASEKQAQLNTLLN
jgi:hypothetical protein